MRFTFFILVCGLTLSACNQRFFYKPATNQPEPYTQLIYNHGIPSLRLNENGIDVAIDLTARGQRDLSVMLAVRNRSDSVFTFFPELVRATGFDASGRKTPCRVFTAEQFIRRRNTRNAIIAGVAVAATVATVAAVASNSSGSGGDSNNNNYDDDWYWLAATAPGVVWVPGAPPAPFNGPVDGLLRPHTLYPGEELRGIVKIQARTGFTDKVLVEIPIDGGYRRVVFDSRERRF